MPDCNPIELPSFSPPCTTSVTIASIAATECIGSSLTKINNNFSSIETELGRHCNQINDVNDNFDTFATGVKANLDALCESVVVPPIGSIVMFHLRSGETVTINGSTTTSNATTITSAINGGDSVKPTATDGTNWVVCNGASSTPDLRGQFIVAAGTFSSAVSAIDFEHDYNDSGSDPLHILTIDEMPTHSHIYSSRDDDKTPGCQSTSGPKMVEDTGNDPGKITSTTGGNQAHPQEPQWYSLMFIQRIS